MAQACAGEVAVLRFVRSVMHHHPLRTASGSGHQSLQAVPVPLRLANALAAYGSYLWRTIWPVDLAVLYPLPKELPLSAAICCGLILVALSLVFFHKRHQTPALLLGWLWFLGTLIPVIGLVQVGAQSMADRYTYLPLIGLFIAAVWGLKEIPHPMSTGFALLVLGAFAFGSRYQLQYWQDGATLFTRAVTVTRENAIAHNNLGTVLSSRDAQPKPSSNLMKPCGSTPITPKLILTSPWI